MLRRRRRYTREFKLEAVRLTSQGRSAANVATELGVTPDRIVAWKRTLGVAGLNPNQAYKSQPNPVKWVLSRHVLLEVHDLQTGEIDASAFASALSLSVSKLADIVGCERAALVRGELSEDEHEHLSEMYRLVAELRHKLGSLELARVWLRAPHPELRRGTPIDYLRRREFRPVVAAINAIAV